MKESVSPNRSSVRNQHTTRSDAFFSQNRANPFFKASKNAPIQKQDQPRRSAKPQQKDQTDSTNSLPLALQNGVEQLSGLAMDDVRVHRNSSKPQELEALAYAQGTDIHLAAGQERHLPHEAWHVVQQKQGRVKPTLQMKEGVHVNDEASLEAEADVMGEKAAQTKANRSINLNSPIVNKGIVQRTRWEWIGDKWKATSAINTPYPSFRGGEVGAVFIEEPMTGTDFSKPEKLENGTIVDYPALTKVMSQVNIGVEVKSSVWRKMRKDLSASITLADKSHPAHGSNFDKNQRPEEQIKDWAKVISGELKQKLYNFFKEQYDIYLN